MTPSAPQPVDSSASSVSSARSRLLAAAITAFGERGFHGTTTRDIATAAGMSPAALYVHHRSKEDLLYAISFEGHESLLELMRATVVDGQTPTERLRAVMHAFVLRHALDHTRARIINYDLEALTPEHRAEIVVLRRGMDALVRQIVEDGVATGEFTTTDARLTTLALLSLGVDVSRWFRDNAGPHAWSAQDVATHYAGLALQLVGATD